MNNERAVDRGLLPAEAFNRRAPDVHRAPCVNALIARRALLTTVFYEALR
jgi:hypothetical protein